MVINTRYSKRRLLVARRTKEANGALFPYSWIGPFWKDFPFLNIILISFSDTIPYLSPLLSSPTFAFSPVQASQFPKSPLSTLFPFLYHPFTHSMYPFFFPLEKPIIDSLGQLFFFCYFTLIQNL